MKINAIQNQTFINVIAPYKEEDFPLFNLIGVAYGTFQTFLACYGLFPVLPLFTSDEVTE